MAWKKQLEMEEIMNHLDALQDIVNSSKLVSDSHIAAGVRISHLRYQKLSFPSVEQSHLIKMGLQQKVLRLDNIALDARISASFISPKHIKQLCERITRIRRSTSKRVSYFSSS